MLALVACSLLLAGPGPDAPAAEVNRAYQEARARAGKSSEEQVRLALWCEAHGLTRERLNHLALAVLADPANATARGLMGLVAHGGRFQRPEAVAEKARSNPALAEYDDRRSKAPYTADGQWALGTWADEHGLREQARAHFTAVTRLDPSREHAWKRLGYRRHGARWITEAQADAEKAEAEAQKLADKEWRPRLARYKAMLDQPARREEADSALLAIADPRAVPAIVGAFVDGRPADQLRAVQLLGQVDAPAASRALAALAVFPRAADVRRAAIETLARRDPRDFVRLWIGMIRDPVKYEVKPVGGPGMPGTLFIEGQRANLRRVYAPPPMPSLPALGWDSVTYDANGLPVLHIPAGSVAGSRISEAQFDRLKGENQRASQGTAGAIAQILGRGAPAGEEARLRQAVERVAVAPFANVVEVGPQNARTIQYQPMYDKEIQVPIGEMIRETQASAAIASRQLANDVASLDRMNAEARRVNEPVLMALKVVTGGDLGEDGAAWNRWWTDRLGYAITASTNQDVPTLVQDVPIAYTPTASPILATGPLVGFQRVSHACFAAGTTVRTIEGDRPIEIIKAGDLVLSQDPRDGVLVFQPVLAAFHNPPSATLRVRLGDDTVVATGIHRFWKAGKGWTMARELKPGDPVRTLGGVAHVEAVEDERVQPVFNLEVAGGHSFLVGRLGALVHDNSLVEPVPAPFDAPAVAAARP